MLKLPERAYFSLTETEKHWGISRDQTSYLAENGLLRVSVRIFRIHLESGEYMEGDHDSLGAAITDMQWFSGVLDLRAEDLFKLVRNGVVDIDYFFAEPGSYCRLIEPTPALTVKLSDLVIRQEERSRVEKEHGMLQAAKTQQKGKLFILAVARRGLLTSFTMPP